MARREWRTDVGSGQGCVFTPCVVLLCGTRAVAVLTGTRGCTRRALTCLLRNVLAEEQRGRMPGEVEGGAGQEEMNPGGWRGCREKGLVFSEGPR